MLHHTVWFIPERIQLLSKVSEPCSENPVGNYLKKVVMMISFFLATRDSLHTLSATSHFILCLRKLLRMRHYSK